MFLKTRCCFGRPQVVLVRWNEPFQKLATCDMEGGIFVWIQYEGRWSVELVNDRGAQVQYSVHADETKVVMSWCVCGHRDIKYFFFWCLPTFE